MSGGKPKGPKNTYKKNKQNSTAHRIELVTDLSESKRATMRNKQRYQIARDAIKKLKRRYLSKQVEAVQGILVNAYKILQRLPDSDEKKRINIMFQILQRHLESGHTLSAAIAKPFLDGINNLMPKNDIEIPPVTAPISIDYEIFKTPEWDDSNMTSTWLKYTTHFRQRSKLLNDLKELFKNRIVWNKPGRKPNEKNEKAMAKYKADIIRYKTEQADFEKFNAEYLIKKGIDDFILELYGGKIPLAGVTKKSFREIETHLFFKVKPTLDILLQCKKIVEDTKDKQKKQQDISIALKALNQPSQIINRIIDDGQPIIYYKMVKVNNENVPIPLAQEDINILQGVNGDALLKEIGDIWIDIQPQRVIVPKNTYTLGKYYVFNISPEDLALLDRRLLSAILRPVGREGQRPPLPKQKQKGGRIAVIGNNLFANTVNRVDAKGAEGTTVNVTDLLRDTNTFGAIDTSYIEYIKQASKDTILDKSWVDPEKPVPLYSKLTTDLIDELLNPASDLKYQDVVPLTDALSHIFDDIFPLTMSEIQKTKAWADFKPPPKPFTHNDRFQTPKGIAFEKLAAGDSKPITDLCVANWTSKVADACHDFPKDAMRIIDNALYLAATNKTANDQRMSSQLQKLKGSIKTTADQSVLEHFAIEQINEVTDIMNKSEYVEFKGKFLPPTQREIARGKLSDVTDGVRAVDKLARYIASIVNTGGYRQGGFTSNMSSAPTVSFEAVDHTDLWNDVGFVPALLMLNVIIEKPCDNIDKLDAAANPVPTVRYAKACVGIPACPPIKLKGWDILFDPSEPVAVRNSLDPLAGILYTSKGEYDALVALQGADPTSVILNCGLPNVCEKIYRHGDKLKINVYCKVTNIWRHVCTHDIKPFSVNSIGTELGWNSGRGGLLTAARGDAKVEWSPYIEGLEGYDSILAKVLKETALVDRKCSGDGRMTALFGVGITLDVLAGYFFLLFYGVALILIKGAYRLISLRPLPSDGAMHEEQWKGLHFLKAIADGVIISSTYKQYSDIYDILEKIGTYSNTPFNDLESLAFVAASAGFLKLRRRADTGKKIDLPYLKERVMGATIESWPFSNIPGWLENELQIDTAKQTYLSRLKELQEIVLKLTKLVPITKQEGGGNDTDNEEEDEDEEDEEYNEAKPPVAKPAAASAKPASAKPASAKPASAKPAAASAKPAKSAKPAAAVAVAVAAPAAPVAVAAPAAAPVAALAAPPLEINYHQIQLQLLDELRTLIINSIDTPDDEKCNIILLRILRYAYVWDNKSNYISIPKLEELLRGLLTDRPSSPIEVCINDVYRRLQAANAKDAAASGVRSNVSIGSSTAPPAPIAPTAPTAPTAPNAAMRSPPPTAPTAPTAPNAAMRSPLPTAPPAPNAAMRPPPPTASNAAMSSPPPTATPAQRFRSSEPPLRIGIPPEERKQREKKEKIEKLTEELKDIIDNHDEYVMDKTIGDLHHSLDNAIKDPNVVPDIITKFMFTSIYNILNSYEDPGRKQSEINWFLDTMIANNHLDNIVLADIANNTNTDDAMRYVQQLIAIKAEKQRVFLNIYIDEQNKDGYSALMNACRNENTDLIRFLLANGANLDLKNTLLQQGRAKTARNILKASSNPAITSIYEGLTPISTTAAAVATAVAGGYRSKKTKQSKKNGNGTRQEVDRLLSHKLKRHNLHRSHRRPRPASATTQRTTQRRRKSN